jgi:hypothetical protein
MTNFTSLSELNASTIMALEPVLKELDPTQVWLLIDIIKESHEHYAQLIEEGKISKDDRYKADVKRAVDYANKLFTDLGLGEV